nr:MAG TPA: hypothetical protein [Caudoviricetes sp.]
MVQNRRSFCMIEVSSIPYKYLTIMKGVTHIQIV